MEGTGAAGSIFSPVNVLNTSTTACTLDGRPGVTLVGAVQGAQSASLHTTILTTGQGSVFGIAASVVDALSRRCRRRRIHGGVE